MFSLSLFIFPICPVAKPIDIVQGLENMETFDGGEALFECAISRPEKKDCCWLLDGKPVKESPNVEIVSFESGRRHLLLLKELSVKDSCTVTFKAGTASTSAQLSVKGESLKLMTQSLKLYYSNTLHHRSSYVMNFKLPFKFNCGCSP